MGQLKSYQLGICPTSWAQSTELMYQWVQIQGRNKHQLEIRSEEKWEIWLFGLYHQQNMEMEYSSSVMIKFLHFGSQMVSNHILSISNSCVKLEFKKQHFILIVRLMRATLLKKYRSGQQTVSMSFRRLSRQSLKTQLAGMCSLSMTRTDSQLKRCISKLVYCKTNKVEEILTLGKSKFSHHARIVFMEIKSQLSLP